MKAIRVRRERTGRMVITKDVGAFKPEYGAGWEVVFNGRRVAWRSQWSDAVRAASQFAEQYSFEPVPLFGTGS